MTVRAHAPTRIDLAGGTVDLWPIYLLIDDAATVNVAIDLYTEVEIDLSPDDAWHVRTRGSDREAATGSIDELIHLEGTEIAGRLLALFAPERPLSLTTHSEAPPQAGLGASSSLGISIAAALNGLTGFRYGAHELIDIVKDVEVELLRTMTGAQDHYPPVFGGTACLWWSKLGHRREPLAVDAKLFQERFLLAYSHQPHRSGATNWEVVKRFIEDDAQTVAAVERSGRTAVAIRDALVASDLDRVAELIDHDWQARREMAPAVSSPELEQLITAAREGGASAARVCGAGGGGCILLAVPDGARQKVAHAVVEAGGSVLEYNLAPRGLQLLIHDPRDT
jgi:D-glycero-alpha-D-manno-heptose-7-phosphate kinase